MGHCASGRRCRSPAGPRRRASRSCCRARSDSARPSVLAELAGLEPAVPSQPGPGRCGGRTSRPASRRTGCRRRLAVGGHPQDLAAQVVAVLRGAGPRPRSRRRACRPDRRRSDRRWFVGGRDPPETISFRPPAVRRTSSAIGSPSPAVSTRTAGLSWLVVGKTPGRAARPRRRGTASSRSSGPVPRWRPSEPPSGPILRRPSLAVALTDQRRAVGQERERPRHRQAAGHHTGHLGGQDRRSSGVGVCSPDSDALALVEVGVEGGSVGVALPSSSPPHAAVRTRTRDCRTAAGRVIVFFEPSLRGDRSPLCG